MSTRSWLHAVSGRDSAHDDISKVFLIMRYRKWFGLFALSFFIVACSDSNVEERPPYNGPVATPIAKPTLSATPPPKTEMSTKFLDQEQRIQCKYSERVPLHDCIIVNPVLAESQGARNKYKVSVGFGCDGNRWFLAFAAEEKGAVYPIEQKSFPAGGDVSSVADVIEVTGPGPLRLVTISPDSLRKAVVSSAACALFIKVISTESVP